MSRTNGSSATIAVVGGSTTSATLLAGNEFRKIAYIHNISGQVLTLAFSSTAASATNLTAVIANGVTFQVPPEYTGPITGVLDALTGNVIVTEVV